VWFVDYQIDYGIDANSCMALEEGNDPNSANAERVYLDINT